MTRRRGSADEMPEPTERVGRGTQMLVSLLVLAAAGGMLAITADLAGVVQLSGSRLWTVALTIVATALALSVALLLEKASLADQRSDRNRRLIEKLADYADLDLDELDDEE